MQLISIIYLWTKKSKLVHFYHQIYKLWSLFWFLQPHACSLFNYFKNDSSVNRSHVFITELQTVTETWQGVKSTANKIFCRFKVCSHCLVVCCPGCHVCTDRRWQQLWVFSLSSFAPRRARHQTPSGSNVRSQSSKKNLGVRLGGPEHKTNSALSEPSGYKLLS